MKNKDLIIVLIIGIVASLALGIISGLAHAHTATIEWNHDDINVDGFYVRVQQTDDMQPWVVVGTVNAATAPYQYIHEDVTDGVWRWAVSAYNAGGESAWLYSTWRTINAPDYTDPPPGPPTSMNINITITVEAPP